jgi:hypothetical protein
VVHPELRGAPSTFFFALETILMSTATASPQTAVPPQARGFPGLRCPICGSEDGLLYLDLGGLDDFRCTANDCEFTVEDVRQFIGQWSRLVAWIDQAPAAAE